MELFRQAYVLQLLGRLSVAVETYKQSIATFPTAEAYTFLGWTYSWMERYEEAVQEAKKAIMLDPEYGNPYNDIGVYLFFQGSLDEAIPWLEKAISAKRYATPHFPNLNLGGIWTHKGMWDKALKEYLEVLRLFAEYPVPPLPTVPIPLPAPDEGPPPEEEEHQAIQVAIKGYFQAWNSYNAPALQERSAPLSLEYAEALLLNLAYAKLHGETTNPKNIQVLGVQEGAAMVQTELQLGEGTDLTFYVLVQEKGTWKIVGRAILRSSRSEAQEK